MPKTSSLSLVVLIQHRLMTDRRTDGQTLPLLVLLLIHFCCICTCCSNIVILWQYLPIYKSLFAEKNGSNIKTQQYKHKYKQSENNDQVHHSSWHFVLEYKQNITYNHLCSPNLIMYYNLLQNWQKPFTVEMYRNINLSCLLLRSQLGKSIAK